MIWNPTDKFMEKIEFPVLPGVCSMKYGASLSTYVIFPIANLSQILDRQTQTFFFSVFIAQ